jgi:hypothetical protein
MKEISHGEKRDGTFSVSTSSCVFLIHALTIESVLRIYKNKATKKKGNNRP